MRKINTLSLMPRLLIWTINLIPLKLRIWFLERMGLLLFWLDGRHRRITLRNLALAFKDKELEEHRNIARSVFKNLGKVLAEFSYIPNLNKENVKQYVSVEGSENFKRAREKGKGVLFLTAHFGNWEWMNVTLPLLLGHHCHAIFRPLDNKFLDRIVEALRTWSGNHTIAKQKAMGRILRLLKKGEAIGILLDQNVAWYEGIFVNFFGELACTNVGLALLALKTEAPVVPIFNVRQADGRYRVIIEPEVPLIKTGDKDTDVLKNTEVFNQIIERYVRSYPDHWLWLHQRWKTRPWQDRRIKTENNGIMEE